MAKPTSYFNDNPQAPQLREDCYFFRNTSLDGAARDYAAHCKIQNISIRNPKEMRKLAARIVSSDLVKLAPKIKDISVKEFRQAIDHSKKIINLRDEELPLVSIDIDDALDIIEGLLQAKVDLIRLEKGEISAIRNFPENILLSILPSSQKDAEESYDTTINTLKNLKMARLSLSRQADGRGHPVSEKNEEKKRRTAINRWEIDLSQIAKIPEILEDVRKELCGYSRDTTLLVLRDTVDVVLHEFELTVNKTISKIVTQAKRGL